MNLTFEKKKKKKVVVESLVIKKKDWITNMVQSNIDVIANGRLHVGVIYKEKGLNFIISQLLLNKNFAEFRDKMTKINKILSFLQKQLESWVPCFKLSILRLIHRKQPLKTQLGDK